MKRMNKRVNVYMDSSMYQALKEEADYGGSEMSRVVRTALEKHLRETFAKRSEPYPGQQRLPLEAAAESVVHHV